MKKLIKYFLLISIAIIGLFYVIYIVNKKSILNNLSQQEKLIDEKWAVLYQTSFNRINFIDSINKAHFYNDNLSKAINNNLVRRKSYESGCSLDFVKLESDVNECFIKGLKSGARDSIALFKVKQDNDNKINNIVDKYNDRVLTYNKFISVFPNFIIAKNGGFKKKKYFTIKYGVQNEDPIAKSKQLPEWAKGV